jgi:hypothetical protein
MFDHGPVVDTTFEVECENGVWIVASYVTYTTGKRFRNYVAQCPTQTEAYTICNRLRAM